MSELHPTVKFNSYLPSEARNALNQEEQLGLGFLIDHKDINILIHFSSHDTAEDMGDESKFEEPLSRSHIYAIEEPGYDPAEQLSLDAIAKRRFPLELISASTDAVYGRKLGAVYKTGIKAVLADIDVNHRLNQEPGTLQLLPFMVTEYTNNGDNAELSTVQAVAEQIAAHETQREWVILAQLGKHIESLSKTDPAIAEKLASGQLNIFMTYGDLHTGLFHKLREIGLKPQRTFVEKPVIYPALASVIRQKMFKHTKQK